MINNQYLHSDLTDKIIKCYYIVYRELGYGFLEKVYENAMKYELVKNGLKVVSQVGIDVYYDNLIVGQYVADLIVEDAVILELKAAECIKEEHGFQLINYLRATKYEVGLLLNFGKKPEHKRRAFSNTEKL